MKNLLFAIAIGAMVVFAGSCGSSKKTTETGHIKKPFSRTYKMPCGDYFDTKEKFAATGIYRGSSYQKGEVHIQALENAKDVIRSKFHHVYKGMISNYSSSIGNNRGNDIETKMERAGDAVLDLVLNDAYEKCVEWSEVQDDGHIECYVAIEIQKGELASKVSKKVADVLTEDEKNRIKFDEHNYRQQMEERMKAYNESQK